MKLAAALVAMLGAVARAAPAPEAIEVDRDDAPPGRIELGFDGGGPAGAWGGSLRVGYLARPIRLVAGARASDPVDHRETLVVGGAYAVSDGAVLDGRLPLGHQLGARFAGFGDDAPLERFVHGDLALGLRLRLLAGARFAAFVRGELTLPTGDRADFAGEASWTAAWRLIGRATLPHDVVVAATVGIRLRGAEVMIGDRLVGDELAGAVGVVVPLPPVARLWCVPEQVKLTVELTGVAGDNVAHRRGASPVEARIGVVTRPRPSWSVGVRVGAGLDDQIGAPRWRGVVELAWQAPAAPALAREVSPRDGTDLTPD